jgi:hypothetical protein
MGSEDSPGAISNGRIGPSCDSSQLRQTRRPEVFLSKASMSITNPRVASSAPPLSAKASKTRAQSVDLIEQIERQCYARRIQFQVYG